MPRRRISITETEWGRAKPLGSAPNNYLERTREGYDAKCRHQRARRLAQPLDGMYFTRLTLIGLALVLGACAGAPQEKDEMCPAIAAFASASVDGGSHSVRLMTDWGGSYHKSEDPNEEVFFAKDCVHDSFEPGKKLCNYLLEETSTEFPAINYRRALRCIGIKASGLSPTDDHDLPPTAKSHTVPGVSRNVEVTLDFTHGTDIEPPTLKITAGH